MGFTEAPSDDGMPSRVVLPVKLFLDICSYVLLYCKLLHGLFPSKRRAIRHPLTGCERIRKRSVTYSVYEPYNGPCARATNSTLRHASCLWRSIFIGLCYGFTWLAQSIASCCMSSDMSAFLITALRSDILTCLMDALNSLMQLHWRCLPKRNGHADDWQRE